MEHNFFYKHISKFKAVIILFIFISGGFALFNGMHVLAFLTVAGSSSVKHYTNTDRFNELYLDYTSNLVKVLFNDESLLNSSIQNNYYTTIEEILREFNYDVSADNQVSEDVESYDNTTAASESTSESVVIEYNEAEWNNATGNNAIEHKGINNYSIYEDEYNFAYYILNTNTSESYYSTSMYNYIKEIHTMPDNYTLTHELIKKYYKSAVMDKVKYLILTNQNGAPTHITNLTSDIHSNYHLLYYIDDIVSNLDNDYVIYTFYLDSYNVSSQFMTLYSGFNYLRYKYLNSIDPFYISLIVFLLLLISLIPLAGHKKGINEIVLSKLDHIYIEFIGIIYFIPFTFFIWFIDHIIYNVRMTSNYNYVSQNEVPLGFIYVVVIIVFLISYMTIIKRLKTHSFLKSFLSIRFIALFYNIFKKTIKYMLKSFKNFIKKISLTWKSFFMFRTTTIQMLIMLILFLLYESIFILFTINSVYYGFGLIFMILGFLAFSYFLMRLGGDINQMLEAAEKISSGSENTTINPDDVMMPMKNLAHQMNSISTGLTAAVEAKIKSERLKTELITNVSHDIKTPLTSIITYVDLLGKEELNNEKASEYIEVLKEKSWRLKTLIEDLVEASKASTGNISLTIEKLNFNELLKQSAGEFEDRFKDRDLELVLNLPTESVIISADSKSTYRIIDNLFSNAAKYALSKTRIYVDLLTDSKNAYAVIKNISSERLNISTDELMERFIRGDSSRNTEGSGLGLSIANSLTDLQGGSFAIHVDGDLFKITVMMPLFLDLRLPDFTIDVK